MSFFGYIKNKYLGDNSYGNKQKRISVKASVTVEAALVLPMFLFAFCNLMVFFDVLRFHASLAGAMYNAGNDVTMKAFYYSHILPKGTSVAGVDLSEVTGAVTSRTYAKNKIKNYLGSDYVSHTPVKDGLGGLKFTGTNLTAGADDIDLICTYTVKPIYPIITFDKFKMQMRYYGHGWVGYSADNNNSNNNNTQNEQTVYLTKHATVYHVSPDCRHLHVKERTCSQAQLKKERNKSGAKYYACSRCINGSYTGEVVITEYGTRYHSSSACTALEKPYTAVSLSEANAYRKCKTCGN